MSVASAMPKDESPQIFKLDDGVISEGGCLTAFFTLNTDAYMRGLNHVHVIKAVANSQCALLTLHNFLDEVDCDCLLAWSRSEYYNGVCLHEHVSHERVDQGRLQS